MPTTYAHFQFGQDCLTKLPNEWIRSIDRRPSLYNFGVQGPDLLFYSKPWSRINQEKLGGKIHDKPATEIFEKFRQALEKNPRKEEEIMIYAFAMLSHFTLDSTCHPYIERKEEVSAVSHNLIESQYDGYLMRKNGVEDPSTYPRAYLIDPNREDARVIGAIYGLSPDEVYSCMEGQAKVLRVFSTAGSGRRKLVRGFLGMVSPKSALKDLFVDKEENPSCADSNLRLDKLRALALDHYGELVPLLRSYLLEGKPLADYFRRTFGPSQNYRTIPVLSLEEERNYQPGQEEARGLDPEGSEKEG